MKLAYHDDGKHKYQSHEIYLKDDKQIYNVNTEMCGYDILDLRGYGNSKEEAYEDFKKKAKYLFNELRELEKMIFETDELTNNVIKVDCFGEEIK